MFSPRLPPASTAHIYPVYTQREVNVRVRIQDICQRGIHPPQVSYRVHLPCIHTEYRTYVRRGIYSPRSVTGHTFCRMEPNTRWTYQIRHTRRNQQSPCIQHSAYPAQNAMAAGHSQNQHWSQSQRITVSALFHKAFYISVVGCSL